MSKSKKQDIDEITATFKQEFDNFLKTYYVEPVDLVKNIDDMEEQFNTCNKFYIVLSEISNELRNKRDQFQASIKDIFVKKSLVEQDDTVEKTKEHIIQSDDKELEEPKKEKKERKVKEKKEKKEKKENVDEEETQTELKSVKRPKAKSKKSET